MVDRVVIETTPVTGPDKPATPATDKPADQQQAPQQTDRPAWLPDNFKSPEELANSYKELQAQYTKLKQGEKPAEQPADKKPDGTPADKPADQQQQADKKAEETAEALKSKGIDVEGMSKRFWETGKVAEEDLAKLEAVGITREIVQQYAETQVAARDARDAKLVGEVGGKENFDKMATWAREGYGKENLEAFNAAMMSGNFGQMSQAMVALKVAYEKANGADPTLRVSGGNPGGDDRSVYRDTAEMQKDMNDPRYKTSEAFRNDVKEKIRRSKIL